MSNTEMIMSEMKDETKPVDESEQRLSILSEGNPALESCVGECQANGDTRSVKALTASKMHEVVQNLNNNLKLIEVDGTRTEDDKVLLSQTVLDEAIEKFDGILANAQAEMATEVEEVQKGLFTSNPVLSNADIALMSNQVFIDKLIKRPYDFADNFGNASIINHLQARGLMSDVYTTNGALDDALNRRHSHDQFNRLQQLRKDGEKLSAIVSKQRYQFSMLQRNPNRVAEIKKNKYQA